MKRSGPLRRGTGLRRTPFRPKRRTKGMSSKVREEVLNRDRHTCQAAVRGFPHFCGGGLHVHHVVLRSQKQGHDPADLLTVCLYAHDLIHNSERKLAEDYGLIRRSRPEAG